MHRDADNAIMTPGFKSLLDMFLSLVAAGVAYGALARGPSPEFLLVDLAFTPIMLLAGLIAGVPLALVLASSTPLWLAVKVSQPGLVVQQGIPLWPLIILLAALRAGRGVYDLWYIASSMGRLGKMLDTIIIQAGILASVTILGGSVIIYLAEAGAPGSSVHSYLDALWLTLATITTVGYGDMVPVTGLGKAIAGMIMLVGIGLFTFFLSSLAAGLVKVVMLEEPVSPLERKKRLIAEMVKHLGDLTEEEFKSMIEALNLIYTIETADKRKLIEIDLSPESLGINPEIYKGAKEDSDSVSTA